MIERILAIDPGSVDLGIAVYESAVLIHSERIAAPDVHGICPLCTMPCNHASDPNLVTWYAEKVKQVATKYNVGLVISEMPVVFAKSGGGSQLLLLGAIIGAIGPWQGERTKETTVNRPKVRVRWADKKEARQIRNTVLRLGLDRRKVYSLACNDVLGTMESFTGACSGCSCDCHPGCSHGVGGCRECGYTGKRIVRFADPVMVNGQFVTTGRKETTNK